MAVPPDQLSRLVSHALRHEPWVYELELDEEGWAPVDALLTAIHEQGPRWSYVDRDDLAGMIATAAKQRHEMDGERIRALYGHSLPGRMVKTEAEPPEVLFHGTSPRAWGRIQHSGLRPMRRQYVHLCVDVDTAEQVGRRKAPAPVILAVRAREARQDGARFWRGNELAWLADHVPAHYLSEARAAD
jgi:putative RNA 2'-phosphotransferase